MQRFGLRLSTKGNGYANLTDLHIATEDKEKTAMLVTAPIHDPDHTGWQAQLTLAFDRRGDGTVLSENRHAGPLRLQRPLFPEPGVCHAYVLHPPGGVVGGDRLALDVLVQPGAAALMTTPGATKFYRTNGRPAVQESHLHVKTGGTLEWLPQESIVYPGAVGEIFTRVSLEESAGFVGWEILCIGLPACGRPFSEGALTATLAVHQSGRPLLHDRLQITGAADLARPTGLRGHTVCATLVATGCTSVQVARLRSILDERPAVLAGVTLVEDLLVARYLGHHSSEAKQLFEAFWTQLRPDLFGRAACPPRIWGT